MLLFLGRVSCSAFWTWYAIIQLRGMVYSAMVYSAMVCSTVVYSAMVMLNIAVIGRKALVRTWFNPKPIGGGWGSSK